MQKLASLGLRIQEDLRENKEKTFLCGFDFDFVVVTRKVCLSILNMLISWEFQT